MASEFLSILRHRSWNTFGFPGTVGGLKALKEDFSNENLHKHIPELTAEVVALAFIAAYELSPYVLAIALLSPPGKFESVESSVATMVGFMLKGTISGILETSYNKRMDAKFKAILGHAPPGIFNRPASRPIDPKIGGWSEGVYYVPDPNGENTNKETNS